MISIPIRQICPTAYGISQVFSDAHISKHPDKATLGKRIIWANGVPWLQWVCFDNAGRWATAGTAKEAYRLYRVCRETKN